MFCYKLNFPAPFAWAIKGIGKCAELVAEMQRIMQLPAAAETEAQITAMPRQYYDSLPEPERSGLEIFYARKAVRLFRDKSTGRWLLVLPEDILSDRNTRIVLMWLMLKPFYLHCLLNGGLPVHASSADLNGKGIIIAAAGDTGKTTTVRRLPPPWRELGDDAALLLPCRDGFNLYPLPTWSEFIHGGRISASWDIIAGAKLAAAFFLEQSDQDGTCRLARPQATMALYNSCMEFIGELRRNISQELNVKIFDTAVSATGKIPAFSLRATLNGKVWESVESALAAGSGEKKETVL